MSNYLDNGQDVYVALHYSPWNILPAGGTEHKAFPVSRFTPRLSAVRMSAVIVPVRMHYSEPALARVVAPRGSGPRGKAPL